MKTRYTVAGTAFGAVAAALIAIGFGVWAAAPTKARVPSTGQGIEPFQLMMNAKDLPSEEFADYTFVFWAAYSTGVATPPDIFGLPRGDRQADTGAHRLWRFVGGRPGRRAAEQRDELASSHVGHRLAPLCTLTTARAANLPHVQPGAEVNWFTRRSQTLTKNYWRRIVVGAML
jgi:hypothetical protein